MPLRSGVNHLNQHYMEAYLLFGLLLQALRLMYILMEHALALLVLLLFCFFLIQPLNLHGDSKQRGIRLLTFGAQTR